MGGRRVRFAFEITEGPNAGLRCGGWRVWTNKDDTYITAKTFGGVWKGSLHGDEAWRWAITRQNAESEHPMLPGGADRAGWVWEPTPFVDGVRLAFGIGVTRGALLDQPASPKDRHRIAVEDRWDVVSVAKVWMTEPGAEPPEGPPLEDPLRLANGRKVWVTASREPIDPEPSGPMAGAVVFPCSPDQHGVRSPGVLIRGFRWSTGDSTAS